MVLLSCRNSITDFFSNSTICVNLWKFKLISSTNMLVVQTETLKDTTTVRSYADTGGAPTDNFITKSNVGRDSD